MELLLLKCEHGSGCGCGGGYGWFDGESLDSAKGEAENKERAKDAHC